MCDGLRALPGLRPLVAAHVELRGIDTFLTGPRRAPLDERTRAPLASLMQGLPEVVRIKVWSRDATVSPGERDSEVALPS